MRKLLLGILLTFLSIGASAKIFILNKNCKDALQKINILQFKDAVVLIENEKTSHPENAAPVYLEHYLDFMRSFISEEQADFTTLKKNFDQRLEIISLVNDTSPWKRMIRGEMIMQVALVKLKFREFITAGYLLRKSYRQLQENHRLYPEFVPNLKYMGFLHSVIGAVPENYVWLVNLAGMHGSIAQGAKELNSLVSATENNPDYEYMHDEALFLKIFIATHFEKDTASALMLTAKMNAVADKGALHLFLIGNTLITSGKQKEALEILNSFTPPAGSYPVYYLSYMSGIIKLNNLDFDAANDFNRYVRNYKGMTYLKSGYQRLAWISILKGDEPGYRRYLEKVKTTGSDLTDEDKQAEKEATVVEIPNLTLLRSRLLFDGGNYNQALTELAGKPSSTFTTLKDQLEFTYRLARIFDKKDQKDKAINFYIKTFDIGKSQAWYFAANAALNIGVIYEERDDKAKATEWYKKCLALRNHEYQNSIDQKAEGGLDRLKSKR